MHQLSSVPPIDAARLAELGDTVCVWAHPDDETYLSGGVMAALRRAGHRVVCVTATRGERGGPAGPDELRPIRTRELESALAALGVDEHVWLDLPDGGLADVAAAGPVQLLADLLLDIRPRSVLSFAPDGLTGHPDHSTVASWTEAAFAVAALPHGRLLQAATTPGHRARFGALERELGVHVGAPAPATPIGALAVHAVLDGELLDRKVDALTRQASQTAPLLAAMGEGAFREWVAVEAFRPACGP